MICNNSHDDIQHIMANLPITQGGSGRHKCAACAFEEGYNDGLKGLRRNIETVMNSLPDGQAKAQRHKSPELAYAKGLEIGEKVHNKIMTSSTLVQKYGTPNSMLPKVHKKKGIVPQLLQLYHISDKFVIGVFQGTLSPLDIVLKYWKLTDGEWGNAWTPLHLHWVVDIMIKQEINPSLIEVFINSLKIIWDNNGKQLHFNDKNERLVYLDPERLYRYVFIEEERYNNVPMRGEYPWPFLILLAQIMMAQEKTNYEGAYMFRELLDNISNRDFYRTISQARQS